MKIILPLFFFFLCHIIHAQNDSISISIEQNEPNIEHKLNLETKAIKDPVNEGSLTCNMDDTVLHLINFYNDQNKSKGYKVQLYSGRSRLDATKIKSEFNSKYPNELSSVIIYQQPNYKLRAGNFRDRLTALKYLELLKIEFPSAFIVRDEIQVEL